MIVFLGESPSDATITIMSVNIPSSSVYEVFEHQKVELLQHLLDTTPSLQHVMVFFRTRDGLHTLTSDLGRAGVDVESVHGQKKQELRQRSDPMRS